MCIRAYGVLAVEQLAHRAADADLEQDVALASARGRANVLDHVRVAQPAHERDLGLEARGAPKVARHHELRRDPDRARNAPRTGGWVVPGAAPGARGEACASHARARVRACA